MYFEYPRAKIHFRAICYGQLVHGASFFCAPFKEQAELCLQSMFERRGHNRADAMAGSKVKL
jgi:hypothetical protein